MQYLIINLTNAIYRGTITTPLYTSKDPISHFCHSNSLGAHANCLATMTPTFIRTKSPFCYILPESKYIKAIEVPPATNRPTTFNELLVENDLYQSENLNFRVSHNLRKKINLGCWFLVHLHFKNSLSTKAYHRIKNISDVIGFSILSSKFQKFFKSAR